MIYDKALLMKKKSNEPYIRKNGFNYTRASIYCCVNKNNKVTDIGFIKEENTQNGFLYCNKEQINKTYFKKFVSKSSLEKSKSEDEFVVFITNDLVHFNNPLYLERKVRGCRFADDIEIEEIKRHLIIQYLSENKITYKDMFYNNLNYKKLYELCMLYDLQSTLFDLESEGGGIYI